MVGVAPGVQQEEKKLFITEAFADIHSVLRCELTATNVCPGLKTLAPYA